MISLKIRKSDLSTQTGRRVNPELLQKE